MDIYPSVEFGAGIGWFAFKDGDQMIFGVGWIPLVWMGSSAYELLEPIQSKSSGLNLPIL